ncbi:MAG: hypothetical protein V8T17_06120 [Oscillospiraceae bacterium]
MKSKRRKIFYVALSILIAATIWFYVNNKESVTVYVHDVPIEFLNEDTSLADKGLMRISGDEDITVDLKLQMPRNVVYDFDTSELRLVSDLSTITYAGKQSVSYTILYPSKVSSNSVKVESPTIRTVQVDRRAQQEGHRDSLQGRRQCGRGLHRRYGRDAARNARGARPAG